MPCALPKPRRASATSTGCASSVVEALDLLEPIEGYWVFPGRDAIAGLRRLLEAEDYRNLALLAGRIVRALSTDAYRRRAISLRTSQEAPTARARSRRPSSAARMSAHGRPYFEVLVVDAMGPLQEAALKQGMRQARRPDDPFIYELLVVQSVEDALIAVLTNYNIQTVVIRFSFPYRSVHQIPAAAARAVGRRPGGVRGGLARRSRHPAVRGDRPAAARAVRLHRHRRLDRGDGRADAAQLPARVLPAGGLPRAAPQHPARRQRPLPDAVLHRAQGVQPPADRRVPRHADQPRQVDHQVPLDPGHGPVLRDEHLPGRDLGDLGRARFAAGADRPDQEGAATGRRAPSARSAPISSPTAPRPPTRS